MTSSAFPRTITEWNPETEGREVTSTGGMTLRDYFAIHARECDITAHRAGPVTELIIVDGFGRKHVARVPLQRTNEQARYAFADAMLAAREAA